MDRGSRKGREGRIEAGRARERERERERERADGHHPTNYNPTLNRLQRTTAQICKSCSSSMATGTSPPTRQTPATPKPLQLAPHSYYLVRPHKIPTLHKHGQVYTAAGAPPPPDPRTQLDSRGTKLTLPYSQTPRRPLNSRPSLVPEAASSETSTPHPVPSTPNIHRGCRLP